MQKIIGVLIAVIMCSFMSIGCNSNKPSQVIDEPLRISFDFEEGNDGFATGFADLPENYVDDGYMLQIGYCDRPQKNSEMTKSIILKGENHNKDMFLYTYRKIDGDIGLSKNTDYQVSVSFDLGTSVAKDISDTGTSPGQKIYVKMGIVNKEPIIKLNEEGNYTLNLDKGNHSLGGKDIVFMGNVEKTDDMYPGKTFEYKHFEYRTYVQTNEKGACYLLIGYDSKYEGVNWHYIDNVVVTFEKDS